MFLYLSLKLRERIETSALFGSDNLPQMSMWLVTAVSAKPQKAIYQTYGFWTIVQVTAGSGYRWSRRCGQSHCCHYESKNYIVELYIPLFIPIFEENPFNQRIISSPLSTFSNQDHILIYIFLKWYFHRQLHKARTLSVRAGWWLKKLFSLPPSCISGHVGTSDIW